MKNKHAEKEPEKTTGHLPVLLEEMLTKASEGGLGYVKASAVHTSGLVCSSQPSCGWE